MSTLVRRNAAEKHLRLSTPEVNTLKYRQPISDLAKKVVAPQFMGYQLEQPRIVAKVTYISNDQKNAILDLKDGRSVTCTSSAGFNMQRGDVLFIDFDTNDIRPAPQELWVEEAWIGVVRLLLPDEVVVEISGTLKKMKLPAGIEIREGNTVEGFPGSGISGIVSDRPIRALDISAIDPVSVDHFKTGQNSPLSFDDFGGYSQIVQRARELIELPLEQQQKFKRIGARPIKGVLLTGPPGTGKTLLARIIATQAGAQFYDVSGPQILSKWYGQSEEIIRKIFEDAAQQERAIVFFDEIDSLASQRNDDSHEASRRIVGQLLTEMDGFKPDTNVIVLATTNRKGDIDRALRRPGRFDWELHFPLPTREDREAILITSARTLHTGSNMPHSEIADLTEGWPPAALTAIWSEAAILAVQDDREVILAEDYRGGFERVSVRLPDDSPEISSKEGRS